MGEPSTLQRKNKRLMWIMAGVVIAMFGFGYALVPLYNTLCEALSINGKTNSSSISVDQSLVWVDKSRTVTVEFIAHHNSNVNWDFYPNTHRIRLSPGETEYLEFYASNKTSRPMTVQAIPSVTPGVAAKYVRKTECFCFEQQTLQPGEGVNMPILFHLDPDLPKDISTFTLSYTLFDVTDRVVKASRTPGRIQ